MACLGFTVLATFRHQSALGELIVVVEIILLAKCIRVVLNSFYHK